MLRTCVPTLTAVMSLALFVLMGADKWKAKHNAWRIKESTLFLFAVLLGAPGGYAGMLVFRHKTRHTAFRLLFPLLATAELILCGVLLFR